MQNAQRSNNKIVKNMKSDECMLTLVYKCVILNVQDAEHINSKC